DMLARQMAGELPRTQVPYEARWAMRLGDLARQALQLEPAKRFATAGEFASALRAVAHQNIASTEVVAKAVRAVAGAAITQRRKRLFETGHAALGAASTTIAKATRTPDPAAAAASPRAVPSAASATALPGAPKPTPSTGPMPAGKSSATSSGAMATAKPGVA